MSRSTLLRILYVCSASTRKSLQGLDYISSAGAQAFEDLEEVTNRLGEMGMGHTWAKRQKETLKEAKRYLKTDYKVRRENVKTKFSFCYELYKAFTRQCLAGRYRSSATKAYMRTYCGE